MPVLRRVCLAIAPLVLATACATVEVEPVTSKVTADGLIYALPNTVLRIQLKVDRVAKTAAKYAAYAAIFAPDGKPVCNDESCSSTRKVTYGLAEGVTFTTYGEPDPKNVFLVKFSGGGALDQTLSMSWTETGLLSSASASVTNRSADIATSGLKLLAGVGTKLGLGAVVVKPGRVPECSPPKSEVDTWAIPILQKASDAAPALIDRYCALEKSKRDALPRNDALLAAAVDAYVKQVLPLTLARNNILNGITQSLDQGTLLTKIESELDQQTTALYIGKTATQSWEGTLDVRTFAPDTSVPILGLDSEQGICIRDAEVPPDAKLAPQEFTQLTGDDCAHTKIIALRVAYYPKPDLQLFSKITDSTKGKRSFRYRIPAQVSVSVVDGDGKSYGAGVVRVAQLGTVVSLPAQRHTKTLTYDLAFVEATGALKTFKLGTTGGLDSGTLDALGSVGTSVIDARNAAQKNASEAAVLTRQDQLLKLRDDICTIQAKYGIKCSDEP